MSTADGALARLARLGDPRAVAALRAQLWSRRTWIWAAVLTILAGVLCFIPLFNALGYEFAFVIAIAASFAGADLGAALTRRLAAIAAATPPAADEPPTAVGVFPGGRLVASAAGAAVLLAIILLVPPLLLVSANALRVRQCDWSFGFACYGAMTLASAAWSAGVGVACALVTGRRRVLSNLLPHAFLVACILHSLWRFYAAPPVFSYNPLAGYFPGNLYDEDIALETPLLWSRLHQGLMLVAVLALLAALIDLVSVRVVLLGRRRPAGARFELAVAVAALLGAVAIRADAGELGYSLSSGEIEEALGGRHESASFVIHYPPGGDIERDIERIAEDHEFRLAQVVRTLGARPPRKIHSFYFQSPDQKARYIGARNVYMAKPWREEIYVHHEEFPHQVLRHEIAHVVAGTFGDPIFHVSAGRILGLPVFFNVGMIEGIAVAADWPDHFNRPMTPHQSVKAMTELGFAPPVERLLSTGFFAFSSARSYTAAGSFVRFLLDRYGAERLRELYRSGGDFAAAYDKTAGELADEWREMIGDVRLPAGHSERVRERFRRGGIFQRPCPHAVAGKRREAARLVGRGRVPEAIELQRSVCTDDPAEPTYRFDLAELMVRGDRRDDAREIYRALADDAGGVSTTLRAEAHLAIAALASEAGDAALVARELEAAAALEVDDDLARKIVAQRLAAAHTGPAAAPLRSYFWPPDSTIVLDPLVQLGRAAQAAAAEPELALAHYLVGRNLSGRGAPAESARALARAIELGLPDPLLVRECASLLAAEAYLAGDFAAVERAAALLTAADQPMVTQLYGFDFLERVAWKRSGRLPDAPLGPPSTPVRH